MIIIKSAYLSNKKQKNTFYIFLTILSKDVLVYDMAKPTTFITIFYYHSDTRFQFFITILTMFSTFFTRKVTFISSLKIIYTNITSTINTLQLKIIYCFIHVRDFVHE